MKWLSAMRAEFLALVPDEAAAERLLVRIRWPDGVTCPHCGSREMTRLTTRPCWQCRICRSQTSVRSGTVLHRTRKPLLDWLYAAWVVSKPGGASTRSLVLQLGYRYETLWTMIHKLRASLAERGVWQLAGEVTLAAAVLRVTKRAKGDPGLRAPAVIAIAVTDEGPTAPGKDAVRTHTAAHPDQPDADLLDSARLAHVELGAEVKVEPGRLTWPAIKSAPPVELVNRFRGLRFWLLLAFGGVSRRYLPNYLAQFTYMANRRCSDRGRRFEWIVRRLAWEPWRPRSKVALVAP